MAPRIMGADVNAGRASHTVAGDSPFAKAADQRLFDAENVLLDEIARTLEVN